MFPPAGAEIHRNEAGEVIGWDNPNYFEPEFDDTLDYDNLEDDDED